MLVRSSPVDNMTGYVVQKWKSDRNELVTGCRALGCAVKKKPDRGPAGKENAERPRALALRNFAYVRSAFRFSGRSERFPFWATQPVI